MVEVLGRPLIVGEVVNIDVDPADITLTGVLRGEDGEVLARYNATDRMKRTLNPKESTPFVIEFEAVAAGTDPDFDPLDFTPIELDGSIDGVELYAKAVVATQGLFRDVQIQRTELERAPDGSLVLSAELRNDGTVEAVLPIVLVSYLDDEGRVLWVDRAIVPSSIRPQRTRPFEHAVSLPSSLRSTDTPVMTFHNGIAPTDGAWPAASIVAAPPGHDFASVRVDVVSMLPPGEHR